MANSRSPDEIMRESWQFWTGEIPGVIRPYRPEAAYAWLSMQGGETSFRWPFPIGDHGHAFGPFQDQQIRINEILANTGINLKDPNVTNLDALRAAEWETTYSPHYRQIRPVLEILTTLEANVAILVWAFEQSANKPRDIVRRMNLARDYAMKVGPGVVS